MNMQHFPMGSGSGAPPSCFLILVASRGPLKNSQPVRVLRAHTSSPSPTLAQQVSDLHPVVQLIQAGSNQQQQ